MNKLTLGSFFDGVGGWLKAATNNGVEPIWSSEIDPYPAGVTAHWFPDVKQLGDITKLTVDDLDYVDIICAGSPCFTGDTQVKTPNGLVSIKELKVGDYVSLGGNKYKCLNKWNRGIKEIIQVVFEDGFKVTCTPNHKFLCRGKWVEAQNLVGRKVDTDTKSTIKVVFLKLYGREEVYDIEVEEVHRFALANGVIAKNCQDLSLAGKRAGLGERTDSAEEATRSGLFRNAVDLVHGMREKSGGKYPRWFVWENVVGSFSSSQGHDFQAVLEEITKTEIPMPGSGKWARAGMVRVGECLVEWRVLNAQYFGVAQR